MEDKVTKGEFLMYKAVQESGMFNMFDPRARELTGLDKGTYVEILKTYDELENKYGDR